MAEKKSCSQQVYEEIKARILSMDLYPGEPLVELALCERMNVSRTPVRTALRMLEKDGLVNFIPNRGAYVKPITAADISEIYVIREIMEGYCAAKACEIISDDSIRYIEEKLDLAKQKMEEGDYEQASTLASELHNVIIGLAGNHRIKDYLISIGQYAGRMQHLPTDARQALLASDREHRAIVEALKARDSELAEKLMKAHIRSVRKDAIFEYVTNMSRGYDGSAPRNAAR